MPDLKQIFKVLAIAVATLTGTVIILIIGAYFYFVAPKTGIWDYEISISPWRSSYASHFPRQISADAKDVQYFHQPALMQGGEAIQLRMVLPEPQIRAIRDEASRTAIDHWIARRPAELGADFERRLYAHASAAVRAQHEDYEVFVLRSTPEEEWNHPQRSGIAMSAKYKEVVYWLESM
jgi:hypothetical protein